MTNALETTKRQTLRRLTDAELRSNGSDQIVASLTDRQIKRLLLEMAKRGFPKPARYSLLGKCLHKFTTKEQ